MAGTGATEQSPQSVGVSDSKLHATFRQIAGMLYKLRRMGLPAHPDYQIFAADPQAQIKLDAVSASCDLSLQPFSASNQWPFAAPSPVFRYLL